MAYSILNAEAIMGMRKGRRIEDVLRRKLLLDKLKELARTSPWAHATLSALQAVDNDEYRLLMLLEAVTRLCEALDEQTKQLQDIAAQRPPFVKVEDLKGKNQILIAQRSKGKEVKPDEV